MDFLTALIILAIVVAIFGSKKGKSRKRSKQKSFKNSNKTTPAKRIADREPKPDPYTILYDHWKDVEAGIISVPRWYNDPVTEAQLKRLEDDEIQLPGRVITKGQASDLIGLAEDPGLGELEILKFFKITGLPVKHRSIALIEIERLMADPENASQWNNRPATPIQKEYYRYFGLQARKGLTASEAQDTIAANELTDEQDDEWFSYSDIFEELQDKDFRESYDLKKPSITLIRQAIKQRTDQGEKITELSADDIVDTLLEIKPDLEKN